MTHKIEYDQNDAAARILYAKVNPTDKFAFPILANSGGSLSVQILDPAGIPAEVDNSTHTLQTITYEHHEIHSGSHYFIGRASSLALSAVLDVQVQTPNTTKWSHLTFQLQCSAETAWWIYEDVSFTLTGSTLTPYNNNRNSANTSGTIFYQIANASVALANADTNITGSTLLIQGVIGDGREGGQDERSKELILKQNTKYLFRAESLSAGQVGYNIEWYEHTDKD